MPTAGPLFAQQETFERRCPMLENEPVDVGTIIALRRSGVQEVREMRA